MKPKLNESTRQYVKDLYEQHGLYLRDLSPLLVLETTILKELDKRNKNIDERIVEGLRTLSNFTNYISMELSSVSRSNFRATLPAEKRYNVKYINCVILEAYKYLYGYSKGQKKSIWTKKIKSLVPLIDDQDFMNEYDSLELKIKQFGESNIIDLDSRNLSFHYDLDPMEVYKYLLELDEEVEYQRLHAFSSLINELLVFSFKYIQKFNLTNALVSEINPDYNISLVELGLFSDDSNRLFNKLQGYIKSHTERLDQFAGYKNTLGKLNMMFKIDISTSILSIVDLSKVAMQLSYIYIDLASAIRAFLNGEYTLEKQFNLKQINVIVYEGFNKLYSLNDECQECFWKDIIVPLVSTVKDDRFRTEVDLLQLELEESKSILKKGKKQRQLSVHYDKGIPHIYDMLQGLNPFIEISKSIQLLHLMQKICNVVDQCIQFIKEREEIENKKAIESRSTLVDKIIALSSNLPDDSFKTGLLKDLQKMKTREFFQDLLENRSKD